MAQNQKVVTSGPNSTLRDNFGNTLTPPDGWTFLPAGDAGLTRKVTSHGEFWRVQVKKGRRFISKGIWAPSEIIAQAKEEIDAVRQTDEYKKARKYAAQRREYKQNEYTKEFYCAVKNFLNFHSSHKETENAIAKAVTNHAIPIGSGTVARTSMIPLGERASRAVIAWMRHKTTAYDQLSIKRIKGERRKVRRLLAEQSMKVLEKYRNGNTADSDCPLKKALKNIN